MDYHAFAQRQFCDCCKTSTFAFVRLDEEYFKALLQEQQKIRFEEKLEKMLAEGLATESSAVNEKDWQHVRAELENRIAQNK
jgi:hypothetical protein